MTTYRVTWTEFNDKTFNNETRVEDRFGTTDMVKIFTNIDQGYYFHERLQKKWWATNVTWEHVHD